MNRKKPVTEYVYYEARKYLKFLIDVVKKKCWINLINMVATPEAMHTRG